MYYTILMILQKPKSKYNDSEQVENAYRYIASIILLHITTHSSLIQLPIIAIGSYNAVHETSQLAIQLCNVCKLTPARTPVNFIFCFTIPPATCKEAEACRGQGVTIFTNHAFCRYSDLVCISGRGSYWLSCVAFFILY